MEQRDSDRVAASDFGNARVEVYASKGALGAAAAKRAANLIRAAIETHGRARIVVATGNSQLEMIEALTSDTAIDWKSVEVFHMDEYIGLSADHPSSFRYWIRNRVEERVHPLKVNYMVGDAADVDAEARRYSALLQSAPIHLAFVGFGENGHIAFNDPGVADFEDPATVKRMVLDDACRRQQSGEGHFKDVSSVPREALTMTCPALFRAGAWVCCVPDTRKAEAVRNALEGPISEACPASIVRRHANASVYLDTHSASLLEAFAGQRV
jgi:glucosamine-6-phosphate deaminase